jgi:hypothetical protein
MVYFMSCIWKIFRSNKVSDQEILKKRIKRVNPQ